MNVRQWDGKPISEPGIYANVPMSRYHSGDICIGPSISSSGLRTIETESLAHYYEDSPYNPDRKPQEEVDYFAFGKAAHHLIAGMGDFSGEFVVRPTLWDSWRTKDAKAWRKEQQRQNKVVLTPDDVDMLQGFGRSLSKHPTIRAGILNGLVEHSIFWRDELTGVWLKSRPDFIPIDSNMVVDLKTIATADPLSCRRSINDLGYHMQMALVHDGMKAVTGRVMEDHVLVFIEKKPPFCINIKPLLPFVIEYGQRQNRRAINKFAVALRTGEWPGYDDDLVPCGLMDHTLKRLAKEAEEHELPTVDQGPADFEPFTDDAEEEGV